MATAVDHFFQLNFEESLFFVDHYKDLMNVSKDVLQLEIEVAKKQTFPNLYKLFQVDLTIPISSSTCERSFSSMQLVTVNGRPLTISKDSDMQKILKPITQAIGDNGVLKVLNRYDIRPYQVYSCTVDNGANMVKMVRFLTTDNQNDNIQEDNIDEIIEEKNEEDDDSDILANNQYSVETELFNDGIQEHLVHSLKSTGVGMTFCIRCSAHTIQLCL
ncbi:hypothetical protein AGLY_017034 [Aphis glycines]|uniref:HAT C-terminal dimerisation domain-containing protein n=1 Tax=Aphis glycines TaxID=307491 RepID=A0A6G0SX80_APHGL|nr:hypothetical protein AGLY_017034 [Aphis glycines]